MDEPSPCLLRSFSHPSDSSREASEGHIAHAFGGSVSFGRFMSETLDWVKFSTFSQNRYLEEAEKCLKPGLVAQKKAYFEAYFKDIAARKAAALVEANRETLKIAEKSSTDISFVKANVRVWNIDATPITTSPSSSDVQENESENDRLEEEQQACAESSSSAHVEISIELGHVDPDVQEGNVPVKESDNGIVASTKKKKRRVPSTNSLMHNRVPKIPSPPAIKSTLRPPKVGSNAATVSKKAVLVIPTPPVRKRLAPMSVHTSIDFASSIGKTSATSSPIRPQIRSSRVHVASCKIHPDTSQTSTRASIVGTCKEGSNLSPTLNKACKTSRDSSKTSQVPKRASDHGTSKDGSKTSRTQTKASVCGTSGDNSNTSQPLRVSVNRISKVKSKTSQTLNTASIGIESKPPLVTTRAEDKRTKTQLNDLVSGATTGVAVSKWYSQSVDHLNSVKAAGNKSRSTTKAIPFCFRIDERAAKRKKFHEKLEEKSDAREAEKVQLQTGPKRRTEHSLAKLRQSTNTGLKTNRSVAPHVPQSLNNHSKKIPPTQPRSPKLGRKPDPKVQDKITRTPVKSSTSSSSSTLGSKQALEKGHKTTCHVPSLLEKNAIENASPNIQK